ncbi:Rrf2 family transcriptional regulator [Mycobacteroides abscessus]|uniref:Rrf2 family transcriptional regulator n=1 Tax=Mycobacteroides abscessus TaxID=36809 RepID=UPI00092778C0|nr:Rrf2 family transcriptional regulator [Mycobacteroides abscessus]SHQ50722.1 Uncharacterised protein [Mycobacteroides abscessus subsp. abscessus]SKQ83172.1 Uncharacterised protein [Mycobacteroides abscessus subsp. massiliense]SLC50019.1 Uncharacterised protein [Mycobacteroides abscessus subsp. massiliense]
MPSRTEIAEQVVRELVAQTAAGDRVGSTATICEATGLSTGAAIEVMKRFITAGQVVSTRGPNGGYWRTETELPSQGDELRAELTAIARDLAQLTTRVNTIVDKLPTTP